MLHCYLPYQWHLYLALSTMNPIEYFRLILNLQNIFYQSALNILSFLFYEICF